MKNVLITGHTGFLGKEVVELLNKEGMNVTGISRSIDPRINCTQYECDINDVEKLIKIISSKCIDTIIHLAGKAIVKDCEKNPYDAFRTNGLGTAAVLEAARQSSGVKKIISTETDKVYGIQDIMPTPETAELNPGTPYELSKCLASNISDFYRNYYKMDIVSIRLVNIVGESDHNFSRIIPNSLLKISEGRGIPIYDHAKEMIRDFIYVKDLARAIYILATNENKYKVYNLSSNKKITILELAETINKVLNTNIPIEYIKTETNFKEIPEQSIDGTRFIEEYNFKYTSLEEMIKLTFQSFKRNNK